MESMDEGSREAERNAMVDRQIVARGVNDARVLAAMRAIPRHCFVPSKLHHHAYEDRPLRIGCGQTVSQPYMVAIMTELLDLAPEDRVLEIGTGSGYQTAILAALAKEVISIERHGALAESAADRLAELGCANVTVLCADGTLGYPDRAPYDAALVTAGSPDIPKPLKEQLAGGGVLVCPAGNRDVQTLIKITRHETGYHRSESIRCMFVPLVGQYGWPGSF